MYDPTCPQCQWGTKANEQSSLASATCSASFVRLWAIPNRDTFSVQPIEGFVKKYLLKSKCSIDPFARNKRWATHTNDLNPETAAEHHMDSLDFLTMLKEKGVRPDLVIFDPPYNPAQAKECYEQLGMNLPARVGRAAGVWAHEKNVVKEMMADNGVFLWFGWNTCGMAEARGFVIEEIMLVAHGRGHHDTICMAERRRIPEATLWTPNAAGEPQPRKPRT